MKKYALWGGMAFALVVLVLSITNASWLAPYPAGAPKQITHRAFAPQVRQAWEEGCLATRIETPYHRHLPNTRDSILRADRMGGWMIEVDAQLTGDGEIVLLTEDNLDCATDGTGLVGETALADIQTLDAGYGYQVQDEAGTRYPFRGKGAVIPTLGEIARAIPRQARLMVHLKSDDLALADGVAKALKAIDRDPQKTGDAFYGSAAGVARIKELYPDVWAFNPEQARQCTADYTLTGWTGMVPSSCENGTMIIALDDQSLLWGWPNRLIARLEGAGAEILIEAPGIAATSEVNGVDLPEQLTEIPSSFNGYVWTDDAFTTLPALIPSFDRRTQKEIDASQAALERRRAQ
uniref:glycerophosphodiester phosphodiesterase family protein n=1 Tax=uncultured Erythrobacter sp. TaxID=263913 RepID=UPI00260D2FF0|nr:glycerophosphodiester phosphodiesterase family protein [uncultured Erythrobacter sp.]